MLRITIAPFEVYLEKAEEFVSMDESVVLELEHSLVAISKWESIWHKPFLKTNHSQEEHTPQELMDYIKCMTINEVDPKVYHGLNHDNIVAIKNYIDNPMTATIITKGGKEPDKKPQKFRTGKIITSEVIYGWMCSAQIPFIPCENWHINRLMTLIEVVSEESNPDKKKMSKNDILKSNRQLNAARRAKHNTKG